VSGNSMCMGVRPETKEGRKERKEDGRKEKKKDY